APRRLQTRSNPDPPETAGLRPAPPGGRADEGPTRGVPRRRTRAASPPGPARASPPRPVRLRTGRSSSRAPHTAVARVRREEARMATETERPPNADKVAAVAEIAAEFRDASAMVVTEYRGLSMKQISQLRRSLGSDVTYTVAKNTLVKRAAA